MLQPPHPIIEQIPSLRRYARALTGGRAEDADDLVQDTLERAFGKWHLWRPGTTLRPWLFTIMHNVFVNQMSLARNRQRPVALEDVPEPAVAPAQEGPLHARDLVAALGRLSPELREVVLLVSVEDLSYAQTARALGIPIGTVMSRLSRARAQLRAATEGAPRAGLRLAG